jgi:hypothetical protein
LSASIAQFFENAEVCDATEAGKRTAADNIYLIIALSGGMAAKTRILKPQLKKV